MLTPDQVAEMLAAGEMFPKGFMVWHEAWLAAHDKEVLDKAARRILDGCGHYIARREPCQTCIRYASAIRGEGEQA